MNVPAAPRILFCPTILNDDHKGNVQKFHYPLLFRFNLNIHSQRDMMHQPGIGLNKLIRRKPVFFRKAPRVNKSDIPELHAISKDQ